MTDPQQRTWLGPGRVAAVLLAGVALMGVASWRIPEVSANHPVLVEGELDFDGDGRLGEAEDRDEADRVFGTINAALGNTDLNIPGGPDLNATRANHNGRVLIVTSGRFPEVVVIGLPVPGLLGGTATPGVVILEAAPGVDANIEAVVQGAMGNVERQAQPGIVVNMPANRYATIRNIVSRNWTDGIRVIGASRVSIDHVRLDSNVAYGIHVMDTAQVAITNSQVNASGIRANPMAVSNAPDPGTGIEFEGQSSGVVASTVVTGSVGAGIANRTSDPAAVRVHDAIVFDNNPNFVGIDRRGRK